jgi:uncharacterized protein with GYD domain
MNRRSTLGWLTIAAMGFALLPGIAIAQQAAPTMHKYLSRAVLTAEGIKNFQKQKPTALKAGIAKFAESVGGKLESWYFDFSNHIGWAILDYPDDVSAAAAAMTVQAAGFATITLTPLITAEEADRAFEKSAVTRPPQLQ